MKYRLDISAEVLAQILSASTYYDGIREGLGKELEEDVRVVLRAVADNPFACQKEFGPIRRAYVKRFKLVIFYRIYTDAVGIIELRDARQEPPDWADRGFQDN